MTSSTRYIVWMAFASIYYHYNNLFANIHDECRFRVLPLFKDTSDDIIKCMRVAYPWDALFLSLEPASVAPYHASYWMMEFQNYNRGHRDTMICSYIMLDKLPLYPLPSAPSPCLPPHRILCAILFFPVHRRCRLLP